MKPFKVLLLFVMFSNWFFSSGIAQNKISLNQKFIIVLDIQEHFTQHELDPKVSAELIQFINEIIERAEPENVIYIQSLLSKLSISFSGISIDFLPGLNFDERLKVVNNNIFGKNKSNAFTSEDLKTFCESRKVNEIIVVGLMAEHCVLQTLLGGKNLGYSMYYIPEAIAGQSAESKEKILGQLKSEEIQAIPFHSIK